jgi:cell division transport system permease protein
MKGLPQLLHPRLDLPLERDGSGRFLPWIVALMVYLAALALAGMMALHGAVGRWDSALAGTLTVQLPPSDAAQLDKLLATLRAIPGVLRADPLDDAANAKLLEPWLGAGVSLRELQLPRLIDVRLDPAAPADPAGLATAVNAVAPTARIDSERRWLDALFATAFVIEMVAVTVVALVGGATVLSIVFATRTSLAIHHGVVEVLHLIGARDGYIAAQFQWQALRLGLRGGIIGLAGAMLTLLALGQAQETGGALSNAVSALPKAGLAPLQWAGLLILPLVAGVTALVTARLTVLGALARMP